MPKQTSKNHKLLGSVKRTTSPKIYSLLVTLVNENREDLAEVVIRVDYLLEYTSKCLNQKAEERIKLLKSEGVDISQLEYLHEGIKKRFKLFEKR